MIRSEFYILLCLIIIFLSSRGLDDKWANKQFEKIKDDKSTWTWLKIFGIAETRSNYYKFTRIVSAVVIVMMILNIIWLWTKSQ
jgi:hypothetical protein